MKRLQADDPERPDSSESNVPGSNDLGDFSDEEDFISFFNRRMGPRYAGLTSRMPFDPEFDRLVDYQYYRLVETDQHRDASSMLDANK